MSEHWIQQDSPGCPECGSGLSVERSDTGATVSCTATDCFWSRYDVRNDHPYKDRPLNNDEIRSCATNCDHVNRRVRGGVMNRHPLNGLDHEAEAICCTDCGEVIENRPYSPVNYGLQGACPVCNRTVDRLDDGRFSCTLCNWEGHLEDCPCEGCEGGATPDEALRNLSCTECNYEAGWRDFTFHREGEEPIPE